MALTLLPSLPPDNFPYPPAWARQGIAALVEAHPLFGMIEPAAGPLPWRSRPRGFPGLLRTITGQMISNAAAAAIWRRVSALEGALDPAGLLALPEEALRGAGFSRPKVAHARALALACLDGRLRLHELGAMSDAEAIVHMAAVPGLGPWTAAVHLLFAEERADIFPSGDVALLASYTDLMGLEARPTQKVLVAAAEAWSPWRSLAARLLWHWWRHRTGRATLEEPDPAPVLPNPA
ncbi:DNA-3-methyladenine glycosylase 2 family protein [Acetobacteraceae bacterium H6797]|nr:DNA-3-methyladenine glycosylase 2 family protein [Acetobacteraceae bacterium H6797]